MTSGLGFELLDPSRGKTVRVSHQDDLGIWPSMAHHVGLQKFVFCPVEGMCASLKWLEKITAQPLLK